MNRFEKKALAKRAYRALVKMSEAAPSHTLLKKAEGPLLKSYDPGPTRELSESIPGLMWNSPVFDNIPYRGDYVDATMLPKSFFNQLTGAISNLYDKFKRRNEPTPEQQQTIDSLFREKSKIDMVKPYVLENKKIAKRYFDTARYLDTFDEAHGGYPQHSSVYGDWQSYAPEPNRNLIAIYNMLGSNENYDMRDNLLWGLREQAWADGFDKPYPGIKIKGQPVYPSYPHQDRGPSPVSSSPEPAMNRHQRSPRMQQQKPTPIK